MYLEVSFRVAIILRRESQYIWKKQEKKILKKSSTAVIPISGQIPTRAFSGGHSRVQSLRKKNTVKAKKEKQGLFILDTFCFDANT